MASTAWCTTSAPNRPAPSNGNDSAAGKTPAPSWDARIGTPVCRLTGA
jgi:hypothetical protein